MDAGSAYRCTSPLVDLCLFALLPGIGAESVSFCAAFRMSALMIVLFPPPVSPKNDTRLGNCSFRVVTKRAEHAFSINKSNTG